MKAKAKAKYGKSWFALLLSVGAASRPVLCGGAASPSSSFWEREGGEDWSTSCSKEVFLYGPIRLVGGGASSLSLCGWCFFPLLLLQIINLIVNIKKCNSN